MTDSQSPPEGGSKGAQLDYDTTEEIIDLLEENLDALEDEIPEAFESDVEDIEDQLDKIDNAVDDAQDDEGENPLGPVPAYVDYLQRVTEILEQQTGADTVEDVDVTLEALEEQFEGVSIQQTAWYAEVDGVPGVYDRQIVEARALKQQGDVQGDTSEFTVKAVLTPAADLSDSVANFPEDSQDVDLEEFTYFLTEKQEGGVV